MNLIEGRFARAGSRIDDDEASRPTLVGASIPEAILTFDPMKSQVAIAQVLVLIPGQ
ncbi:MAG TPA: hypothetical protein VJS12_04710 [Steroidobacteraceae bacterium]|nr:hypothetical protein [Steroidobacteraceae bacterium]